jgi:hypothetical protein
MPNNNINPRISERHWVSNALHATRLPMIFLKKLFPFKSFYITLHVSTDVDIIKC